MKIDFKDNILVFWHKSEAEEKVTNGFIRHQFEKNGFHTDRCFDKDSEEFKDGAWKEKKGLGVRIFLGHNFKKEATNAPTNK